MGKLFKEMQQVCLVSNGKQAVAARVLVTGYPRSKVVTMRSASKIAILILAYCGLTKADVVVLDHPIHGVGSITRDTIQGLDFLDVTLSTGRSYNDVSGEFGIGGDFEGFRYATESEVLQLANFVFSPDVAPGTSSGASGFFQVGTDWPDLVSNLGNTITYTSTTDGTLGFATPTVPLSVGRIRWVGLINRSVGVDQLNASNSQLKSFSSADFGSFLVVAVPEPSPVLYFCCLGVGLAGRRYLFQ